MALMSYKKNIAIIYASITGNTKELAEIIESEFRKLSIYPVIYQANLFPIERLGTFDAVIVGTYTWGNGTLPREILPVYNGFETQDVSEVVTGVIGTGDSFYPHFCGAVDEFRDMLFVQSRLAATLKVELKPQMADLPRCKRFVESILRCVEKVKK
ncbi:flavodoxin [Bacillus sp. FJAT-18017]|uniref:flavodoxin domain-containing protein n=1 Tax=Bacillus sp. FJAT-18017 TaxID=1705566 RepID=UPI0006BD95AD|nr:flavodoxin domain-containing protein [Bacillus sp. FJAT-18017]ALC92294.1 flavodoxin [Bacillus sp. FJAT-18017]